MKTGATYKLAQYGKQALEGVKGGAKFLSAIVAGDYANDATVKFRRDLCLACPTRVRVRVPGTDAESDWCGTPLQAKGSESCGCLIAGKTLVDSERCPQGKW